MSRTPSGKFKITLSPEKWGYTKVISNLYEVKASTVCDAGKIVNDVICAGVTIVTVIPDNKYYICKSLNKVSTSQVDDGFVEVGFVMFDNCSFRYVDASIAVGKHAASSWIYIADNVLIEHPATVLFPMLKDCKTTVPEKLD